MNLTLHGLEQHIKGAFPRYHGRQRSKVHVIRFADDFIITGTTPAFLKQEVYPLVEQFPLERGLELSLEKTRITHIEDGVDCLGTHVRKYNGKLLCTPAKKHVHAFLEKVRKLVKHHQHGASKRTFAQVDHHIFTLLWQWARRRHPKQSRWWIKEKYFRSENGNHWVFFGQVLQAKGKLQDVRLFRASSVPIRRHTKIKGDANSV